VQNTFNYYFKGSQKFLGILLMLVLLVSCGGDKGTSDADILANYVLRTTAAANEASAREAGFNEAASAYDAEFQRGYDQGVLDQNMQDPEFSAGYEAGLALGNEQGLQEGFAAGFSTGETEGYNEGFQTGYNAAFNQGYDDGFDEGFGDGSDAEFDDGFNAGYNAGFSDGDAEGYDDGYDDGFDDGFDSGDDNGYDDGYDDGYLDGDENGFDDGYDEGYDDGFDDGDFSGYGDGYDDGYDDGYFDGGFSEAGVASKDLEKAGAFVEAQKIKKLASKYTAEFGLSEERSSEIARMVYNLKDITKNRTITNQDANSFSEEVLGFSFTDARSALIKKAEGKDEDMSELIDIAAEKNGTSPERMNALIGNLMM
jgi:flagellar biosynthesis/type III secretory pathway protein FliH